MNSSAEIQSLALKLPQRSRMKLAVELFRSATPATSPADALDEASRRDAELETGKVTPLTEPEFWAGVLRSKNRA